MLTLWEQSEARFNKQQAGLHHLSFQAASLEQVEQAEQKLRALGATVFYEGIVPHSEGASSGGLFFEDPDGIRLEIYTPTGVEHKHAPFSDAPSCGLF